MQRNQKTVTLALALMLGACAGEVIPESMEDVQARQRPDQVQPNQPQTPPLEMAVPNDGSQTEVPVDGPLGEDCEDGVDNDADGTVDCSDADCQSAGVCQTEEPTACDLNTQIAVKISATVSWDGTVGLEGGNGNLEIWYGAQLSQNDGGVFASGRVCGAQVPDFHTTELAGGDTHGTVIPETVWQSDNLPPADLEFQMSGLEPGASLVANPIGLVIGAQLPDPLNTPWPSSHRDVDAVDHDGDGYPGVTAEVAQGPGYANPRVALLNANLRATRIFLALRTIIGLDGVLEDCDRASGAATLFLDQRSLGCVLQNGDECRRQNTDILDSNTPAFRITNATFELVRIEEDASCADIRHALP